MNEKICIFGAGDLGREILVLIRQINIAGSNWNIEGFFDDNEKKGTLISGVAVLGDLDDLNSWKEPLNIVFAIADPETKKKLADKITNPNIKFPVLIHPGVEHHELVQGILCSGW